MNDSKKEFVGKIISAYNAIRDYVWIGDFEEVRKILQEIKRIKEVEMCIKEREKWDKILKKIKEDLKKIPDKKERNSIKTIKLKEESLKIDTEKVVYGSILKDLLKIEEMVTPTLFNFFEQKQMIVKERFFRYTILEKTDREFEVRALVEKIPEKRAIEHLVKVAQEKGFTVSKPNINIHSFSIELYSDTCYIKIRGIYPRILINLSFCTSPKYDAVREYTELIIKSLVQS